MNLKSPEMLLALYGAILSTIVLLWRIYDNWKNWRGRLKVRINYNYHIKIYDVPDPNANEELEYFLKVTVTNKGRNSRYINAPSIQLNKKEAKGRNLSLINTYDRNSYPLKLEPGQATSISYEKDSFINGLRSAAIKRSKKYRVLISDTNDKSYYSNWLEIDK
jgi:hypothetical protein